MQVNRIARAKQFLPFDALKGLQEALREKEIEYEEKKELSEESLNDLQKEFNKIEKGKKVKIRYYINSQYKNSEGIITKIDYIRKKITINMNENINLCDVLKITVKIRKRCTNLNISLLSYLIGF